MKQIVFTLVLALCCAASIFGQTTLDVVTLKNGDTITGLIIEQKPGVHIRVKRYPNNDTLTIGYMDIELLSKIIIDDTKNIQPDDELVNEVFESHIEHDESTQHFNSRDFSMRLSFGGCGGDFGRVFLGLGIYRKFIDKMRIGFMSQFFTDYVGNGSNRGPGMFFTALLDIEYDYQSILNNRGAYFIGLGSGFLFTVKGQSTHVFPSSQSVYSYSNGFYFSPNLGFRINIFQNTGLIFKAGYQGTITNRINYNTGQSIKQILHSNIVGSVSLFF